MTLQSSCPLKNARLAAAAYLSRRSAAKADHRRFPRANRLRLRTFHFGDAGIVFEMIEDQLVSLAFDCNDHLSQLEALAKRYKDRGPDLADLCLICMSELYPRHSVITLDKDFRVYRRNKREVIPLISPPGR
jgi:hypothetical protein